MALARLCCVLLSAACLGSAAAPATAASKGSAARKPDFTREVRPILSRHCFKCHGPDDGARKAKLRLDVREEALRPSKSGPAVIAPGSPDKSELVRRILASSPEDVMPPPEIKNPLSEEQKRVLRDWIASGAEYKTHWAFVPPRQAAPPGVKDRRWVRNPIDAFVLARLEQEGLKPAPAADRYTLVRRVSLDLVGIPPTPEEADAFVNDPAPDAYERLVDRLLASPRYGERWARRWLDLARYADTNGYEKDRQRSIWPYRDWVIKALNADMPFDRFTIEQIAGDMLPQATLEQRVATGFHRNTMLNEEGGIDPLEYRFHAMVDRVATTGATWLGLTLACAQCHTHKFDPVSQREYYQFMAFLNNADEPEIDVPNPETAAKRATLEARIAALVAGLPNRFPVANLRWQTNAPALAQSAGDAQAKVLEDASVLFSGTNPETDTYTVALDTDWEEVQAIRLEAMTHESLSKKGPGRTDHGNFVLSEFSATAMAKGSGGQPVSVKFARAEADVAQKDFPAGAAIDGDPKTGWAIHTDGDWNVTRTATFTLAEPLKLPGGGRITFRLEQNHGQRHTIGRLRLAFGQDIHDDRPLEVRRRELFDRGFAGWLERERQRTVHWTVLRPVEAKANLPLLTIQEDDSVFASGDQTKSDTYEIKFRTDARGITAIRLDALTDDRLPKHGPGRVYYEGPIGDFTLSELTLSAGGTNVPFGQASHTFATGKQTAAAAVDGDPLIGWSIDGAQGRPHHAVFNLAAPLAVSEFGLRMLFERHYPAGLGRFRISVTTDKAQAEARDLPAEVEALLLVPADTLTAAQRDRLREQYASSAPELEAARKEIADLRRQLPSPPTTLVMLERPPENPRPAFQYKRGDFLQPLQKVEPGTLSALPPLPAATPRNRLGFARWLAAPDNPLVGRVTVNRQWAAFFGRGLVRTTEDFGFQGEAPTHPELLDWLAVEFVQQGWSLKRLHRLIVSSATYRQASRASPALLARDAENKLLARGPYARLEAELVRDAALQASGLLSGKIGGPSVFPPQPPGVSTEGAYGALEWKTSQGEDRYRRGLYTFSKRTAPYAMFIAFDAPSGEACVARRDVSNTPLQALTLLNDTVFVEAAQALGRRVAQASGSVEDRLRYLFRRCLTRPPTAKELELLGRFFAAQKQRFESKALDPKPLAGETEADPAECAAWTALARALLNLDEAITKG
jgi:hypothetical protein